MPVHEMAFVTVFLCKSVGYQVELGKCQAVFHIAVSFSVKYGLVTHIHISINLVQGICKNIFLLRIPMFWLDFNICDH